MDHLGELSKLSCCRFSVSGGRLRRAVREEIERRAGRKVTIGAVYATLDRLEAKGYLHSWFADPTRRRAVVPSAISGFFMP